MCDIKGLEHETEEGKTTMDNTIGLPTPIRDEGDQRSHTTRRKRRCEIEGLQHETEEWKTTMDNTIGLPTPIRDGGDQRSHTN